MRFDSVHEGIHMKIPFGTCRSFFHVDSFMSDLFNKGGFKSSHDGFAVL